MRTGEVCIIKVEDYTPLTSFVKFCLGLMYSGMVAMGAGDSDRVFRRVVQVKRKSIVVKVDFPECSVEALGTLRFTGGEGMGMVALASDVRSPVGRCSSYGLVTEDSVTSVISSLITPLDIVGTLVITVYVGGRGRIISALRALRGV